jgi:hypothetical protein
VTWTVCLDGKRHAVHVRAVGLTQLSAALQKLVEAVQLAQAQAVAPRSSAKR